MLLTLPLGACSILRPATEPPVPADAVAVLREVPRVANRRSAPCDMQRQVAVQNSALDSVITGKPVTYAAPCDVEKPAAPVNKPEPKTS